MSKLFWKASIEDIVNKNCTEAEVEVLLDSYEYTVKRMATTLARKAWYELKDYATAKSCGIDGYTLMVERKNILGQQQWHGIFENGTKSLHVIATLSRN